MIKSKSNNKEIAISITKIISIIYKPRLQNEELNDPIYDRCQKKIIKKELQNLKNYEI